MPALVFDLELGVCAFLRRAIPLTGDEPEPNADPGTYSGSGIQLTLLLAFDLPVASGRFFCLACAREMSAMLALARDEAPPTPLPGPSTESLLDESPFESIWSLCFPKKLFWSRVSLSLPLIRTWFLCGEFPSRRSSI